MEKVLDLDSSISNLPVLFLNLQNQKFLISTFMSNKVFIDLILFQSLHFFPIESKNISKKIKIT